MPCQGRTYIGQDERTYAAKLSGGAGRLQTFEHSYESSGGIMWGVEAGSDPDHTIKDLGDAAERLGITLGELVRSRH